MSGPVRVTNLKGDKGGVLVTGAGDITGRFDSIQALEASVVTLVSQNVLTPAGSGALASVPIPAGAIIFGKYTSITWVSGTYIAYHAETHG